MKNRETKQIPLSKNIVFAHFMMGDLRLVPKLTKDNDGIVIQDSIRFTSDVSKGKS